LAHGPALAERVLIRVPAGGSVPESVRVGAAEVEVRVSAARTQNAPSVVVLADWLEPADVTELTSRLKQRLMQTPRKEDFSITVVRGTEIIPIPPVRTAAALEKELVWALGEKQSQEVTRPPPEEILDLLIGMTPEAGEAWREWLWAGRLEAPRDERVRDYAAARLFRLLGESRVFLTVWPEQETDWLPVTPEARGGKWMEAEWDAAAAAKGFEVRWAELGEQRWPVLATAPGFRLPGVAALAGFLDAVRQAAEESAGEPVLQRIRQGLELDPNYTPALEAGAALAERLEDFRAASALLARLEEARPGDLAVLRRHAAAAWRTRSPEAEPVLRRGVEAMPRDAELLEWLARTRLAQGDRQEAYALLQRSLDVRPDQTDLWWITADLARALNDAPGERRSLREALNSEPGRADRRARLIALSLEAGDGNAVRRALEEAASLPADDLAVIEQYASAWEKLAEPARAMPYWEKSIALRPEFEKGHLSVARLHAARGAWEESLSASLRGLERLPASAGLHLARSRALKELGRMQEARRALGEAVEATNDVSVLEARAEMENLFGGQGAVAAWRALLERLRQDSNNGEALRETMQRAVRAALRDGAAEEAGHWLELPATPVGANPTGAASERRALIPGGARLLSHLSGIGGPEDPGEYIVAFARAVAQRSMFASEKEWNEFSEKLLEQYDRLLKIRKPFALTSEGTEIVLSVESQKQRQQTQQILDLLGYRLRSSRGRISIEAQVKSSKARRQNLAAALDLDDREVEESLDGKRPYRFRITDDLAPVILGEAVWEAALKRQANPLGFAGLLLKQPEMARLFAGLSSAGPAAARALLTSFAMRKLAEDYGMLLFLYGPVMALDEQGRCAVPGGTEAEPVWEALAGASPRDGQKFLEALLRKDGGMVLAYFAALHGVTAERQKWFLRSAERAKLFYRLMKDSPEWDGQGARMVRNSPMLALFRELPLDEDGSVRFPGGAQVWQVARGASDLDRIARLERRARKARPAEEDEILERMARERYGVNRNVFSQLENFLMVARVEAALGRALEPREALILSQQFARYGWAYPLFVELPSLGEKEFQSFFAWAESLESFSTPSRNMSVGMVSHLALLAGLLHRSGKLGGSEAAAMLDELCSSTRAVEDPAQMARAAHKAWRRIAAALSAQPGGLQSAMEDALLGPAETPAGRRRRKEFRDVLAAQKIPPVDPLLETLEAVLKGGEGPEQARAAAAALESIAPKLDVLPLPKTMKPPLRLKEILELWRTDKLPEIASDFRQRAAKKKPDVKALQRASAEGLRVLAPWMELSLRGIVGGFYLRPSDLPVSDDPWLLRKYWYADTAESGKSTFPSPEFRIDSAGPGSLPLGSPAGIAEIAGWIALAGQQAAGGYAGSVEAKQIGALRNAQLHRLRPLDLRAARLAYLAGREWVVEAAFDAAASSTLERQIQGLLSPERSSRAARLLSRLRNTHAVMHAARPFREEYKLLWDSVWDCFSHADLFWLGRMRREASRESVIWNALKQVPAEVWEGAIHELGPMKLDHARSARPRLEPMPPYENYAQELLPGRLAERLSEYPLALACAADEAGLTPDALALIAEPLARRLLADLEMTDMADYRSATDLWKRIQAADLMKLYQEELEKAP
jgi:predicted Zn-dependent protease